MRVLIIRPEHQAMGTARKLDELGHEAVLLPLLKPVHDQALAADALNSRYWALAVTSAEAVRCLKGLGPTLDAFREATVFSVGRATARALLEAGFTKVQAASGNGKDLASLIAGQFAAENGPAGPLLYLAGARRSGLFERTLTENGIDCVTAEIYAMEPIYYSIEQQQKLLVDRPVDAAFFFSRENAKAFFELEVFRQSKEALRKTLFFCLSRNIAEEVPEEFSNSAVISQNPDEDELIDLL
ncbi:uroporphyrinogen-III synthase [Rhizobium sp. KVB221]|uniref:Uroporphyrinogen-III synthase n=1 Tax=Rhizobium setariae TaxID=2801340 RepID=A0A937CNR6_9HYPH|nr:uroporphyrinogen-III synthase [Rhizobium setariae]MBL0374061.1 uroporphyrinogen-III synthase [Rhizobium setariae]